MSVAPVTGWEDHDGQIRGSWLVGGQLLTSGHVAGAVLVRVRRRLRKTAIALAVLVLALAASGREGLAMSAVALGTTDVAWGTWRTGRVVRRKLRGDACSHTSA